MPGKFFVMPSGKKAPPQQSSLTELWGSKRTEQDPVEGSAGDMRPDAVGEDTSSDAKRALHVCNVSFAGLKRTRS